MKILLDENIDIRFKKNFPPSHEVYTVKDMEWNGIKNGELIILLGENHFDFWIVADKNIPFQQNLSEISFTIIVLDVFRNTLKNLDPLISQILTIIENPVNEKLVIVKQQE